MDKRTVGIVLTILTVLCCGLPGCFSLFMGGMFIFVGNIPGAEIDIAGNGSTGAAMATGFAMLCAGLIAIIVPIVVGFVSLRQPKPAASVNVPPSEPLPPVS
jgi:hypothetical protein